MGRARDELLKYDSEANGVFMPPPPKKLRSTSSTLLRVVGLSLGAAVVGLSVAAAVLFGGDALTLRSIEYAEEHSVVAVQSRGGSHLESLMEAGAGSEEELESFISKNLLLENEIDIPAYTEDGIVFTAKNSKGDILMCRTVCRGESPAVVLENRGGGAYKSAAVLDMAMLGYNADSLPDSFGINRESLPMLAAPLLSFDGINEKGVAAAALTVNTSECAAEEGKTTLCASSLVRLVLDRAASAEEAVELLADCNVVFAEDSFIHIFIADSTGTACVVEWDSGEMHVVPGSGQWLIAANRMLWNDAAVGDSRVREYKVQAELEAMGGVLSEQAAFELLASAGGTSGSTCSVIYNLTTGEVNVCVGEGDTYTAQIEMKN